MKYNWTCIFETLDFILSLQSRRQLIFMKYEDVTITTCGSMDFGVVQWYFPVYTFTHI